MTAFDGALGDAPSPGALPRLSETQQALLDALLAADGGAASERPAPYAEPSSEVERLLARLWQEVLELPRVGVDDDYFAAGGDSIRAIVIVAKAEAAGVRIGTQDLLEARTIRRLAELAEHAEPHGEPAARGEPGDATPDGVPLNPLQEGMLFHALATDRAAYLVQVACELDGDLDVPAMRAAWNAVVQRHPGLRATFHWSGGGTPVQRHAPHAEVPFEYHDWRSLSPDGNDQALRDYLDADAERGIDLASAPLLRLALMRTADRAHRFVWTHHHLLLDGWSQHLVLEDVLDAYAELVAGRPPAVPARPSAADYADSDTAPPDRAGPDGAGFWRRYLAGYHGPPPLPPTEPAAASGRPNARQMSRGTPRHRGAASTGQAGPAGNAVTSSLPEASSARLNAFCRANGLTVGTVVLGGWAMVLAALTGADDIVVGMTVSGRSAATPGLTGAVGMFINTLPARVRVPGRPAPDRRLLPFDERTPEPGEPDSRLLPWLRELHRDRVAAGRYERTPLPTIARCSEVPPGRPLFDSIVVLENFPSRLAELQPRAGLRIRDAEAFVDEGYPLVVEATPASDLLLHARFDRGRFSRDLVAALLEALRGFLDAVPASAGQPLAGLAAGIGAVLDRHAAATRQALREDAANRLRRSRRQPVRAEDA